MKKTFTLLCLLAIFAGTKVGTACTNFIVTKGASADGSTMITYAADSHTLYGELYFWPAAKHLPGTMRDIIDWESGKYRGKIEEPAETYRVVGNMNEYSLAIGETTFGGLDQMIDKSGLIDYGSLIALTLQRSKNAREAIKVMTELVAKYGYYSGGESFSISDPNEIWILELVGKGVKTKKGSTENLNKGGVWVAVRIPDGYVSAHANQARITTFPWSDGKKSISSKEMDKIFNPEVEVVYAYDVADVARGHGLYKGADKDFSFSDTYNPVDFGGARFCEARVWAFFRSVNNNMEQYLDYAMGHNLKNRMPLYIKPDKKVTFQHTADMMRDHYEGTPLDMTQDLGAGPFKIPYRWRPMTWSVDGKNYVHERAIATQQTAFWFVAQGRSTMPQPLAGILWFGVDDASTSCLTPIYSCTKQVPEEFAVGNGDLLTYSDNSAFWLFSRVTNFAYGRYDIVSQDIIKLQKDLESKYVENVKMIDNYATEMFKKSPDKAIDFVTDFSVGNASSMFKKWKELDNYLLVKYIDGNVKKEKDGKFVRDAETGMPVAPDQPQLPEEWRREIVKGKAGEILLAH